jgi:hypothetical protein
VLLGFLEEDLVELAEIDGHAVLRRGDRRLSR